MRLRIDIDVEDGDESLDPENHTGLSADAYDRLTGDTPEYGPGALAWLGDVQDVTRVDDGR